MTVEEKDAPLSRAEGVTAAALVAAGLVASGVLRVHDAGTWPAAVCLTALSTLTGFALFWAGLAALSIPRGRRAAGALWATVPWNTFLLSQIAYVGFFFIPLEILASAIILRVRAGVQRRWIAVSLAAAVRLLALTLVYAVRPVVRWAFPWR